MWAARQDGWPLVANQGGYGTFNTDILFVISDFNVKFAYAFHNCPTYLSTYENQVNTIDSTKIKFVTQSTSIHDGLYWIAIG